MRHRWSFLLMVLLLCTGGDFVSHARADVIGSAAGIFGNPPSGVFSFDPTHQVIVSGSGQNPGSFNILSCQTMNFSALPDQVFQAAELHYHNGPTKVSTSPTFYPLTFNVALTQPSVQNLSFNFDLHLTITPNNGNVFSSSDTLALPTSFAPVLFSAGAQQYQFRLFGVGTNAQNILSSITVPEGNSASLGIWAEVETAAVTTPLPSAACGALVLLALFGIGRLVIPNLWRSLGARPEVAN
jgi:hypothetical protein